MLMLHPYRYPYLMLTLQVFKCVFDTNCNKMLPFDLLDLFQQGLKINIVLSSRYEKLLNCNKILQLLRAGSICPPLINGTVGTVI